MAATWPGCLRNAATGDLLRYATQMDAISPLITCSSSRPKNRHFRGTTTIAQRLPPHGSAPPRLLGAIIAALLFCSTSAAAATVGATYYVNSDGLNMRAGPGPSFDVLTVLQANEAVKALDSGTSGWCKVDAIRAQGFVACRYLAHEPSFTRATSASASTRRTSSSSSSSSRGGMNPLGFLIVAAICGSFAWKVYRWLFPPRCRICGNLLKRTYYTWNLDGKSTRVCPECNQKLRRRQSSAHFR